MSQSPHKFFCTRIAVILCVIGFVFLQLKHCSFLVQYKYVTISVNNEIVSSYNDPVRTYLFKFHRHLTSAGAMAKTCQQILNK